MDNSSCTFLTSTDNSSTSSRVFRLVGPEILNAYFKQIGLQLIFDKHEKKIVFPIKYAPYIEVEKRNSLITFMDPNEHLDPVKYVKDVDECKERRKKRLITYAPIRYEDDAWIKK